MDISIIIVSYRSCGEIADNMATIRQHCADTAYEVIVVNNFAGDPEVQGLIKQFPEMIPVDNSERNGFGCACNAGLAVARGRYVCFLNPDILLLSSIRPLMELMERDEDIGLAAPLLRNSDHTVQRSCYELPNPRNWLLYHLYINALFPRARVWGNYLRLDFDYKGQEEIGWASGAYMLMRRALAERIGAFDERFFLYCEDLDLCWKIHDAGYRVVFSDCAQAVHIGGTTIGTKTPSVARMMAESHSLLFSKWFAPAKAARMLRYFRWGAIVRAVYWRTLKRGQGDYAYYRHLAESLRGLLRPAEKSAANNVK